MDFTINTKNITGLTNQGERYRICLKDEADTHEINKRYVVATKQIFHPVLKIWTTDKICCNGYDVKNDFREALLKTIRKMEIATGIELIKCHKSELKTA